MKTGTLADGKPALLDEDTGEITPVPTRYQTIIDSHFGLDWKTPFNHDRDAEAASGALVCTDKSKTQQQFARDADINVILAKFNAGGDIPPLPTPRYGEYDEFTDLQEQMVTKHQVDLAWNSLSAEVRNTLKDPQVFAAYVDHCVTTGDLEPLRKLGLAPLPPQEAPAPKTPEVVPPVPPGGKPA